ncbi:hypothetical protein OUZ56_024222 [Daphnia magna]|uniref:Uncharacterized protein n=1 Tax=Daphnia magna TaxID=35525 RepID=A0ABR0B0C8_9CRUS|nr:hypothetical protein OUZ56_024222 [Daphnia magna]
MTVHWFRENLVRRNASLGAKGILGYHIFNVLSNAIKFQVSNSEEAPADDEDEDIYNDEDDQVGVALSLLAKF